MSGTHYALACWTAHRIVALVRVGDLTLAVVERTHAPREQRYYVGPLTLDGKPAHERDPGRLYRDLANARAELERLERSLAS